MNMFMDWSVILIDSQSGLESLPHASTSQHHHNHHLPVEAWISMVRQLYYIKIGPSNMRLLTNLHKPGG
jgi:hypothetical protein